MVSHLLGSQEKVEPRAREQVAVVVGIEGEHSEEVAVVGERVAGEGLKGDESVAAEQTQGGRLAG